MCVYVILKKEDICKKIKGYSGKEILCAYMTRKSLEDIIVISDRFLESIK